MIDNYVIGIGGSSGGNTGPTVTFVPQPGVSYQIQPSNKYYVTFGNYAAGNIIDVTKIAKKIVAVDFTKLPNKVKIKHDQNNVLTIQK